MPAVTRRDLQILTESQAEVVLASLAGTYGYIPALISYHTEMRLGEIIGLPWDAVNLDAATIEVMQSYSLKDEDGAPIEPKAISHLSSRRARSFGYNVTFHGLRHTHVSMLIKAGVPINTISARVGHSTPSITHDVYAHLLPGMGRNAVKLFEDMLAKRTALSG